mmetsp:Transcript_30498/g.49339  ORF Transcript_30498/g.49339 Transcript_30498/m.49339 type:complete len:118 (-) Transcript_30498:388-741(-)|eukprot:CAMPEP_0184645838 /NCGR_PEP_ID=MMETSP0308-20130426/2417_1 /TAXON_ID=38269 /ORGANISM="Gloeochaete witrockiana, Strain SAG 46.84" /LENGTH=117 /DNA_ID=CAMNT_0027075263 /DNA_START=72 /DNA_END=425 /DNA_ORIENTATION=-
MAQFFAAQTFALAPAPAFSPFGSWQSRNLVSAPAVFKEIDINTMEGESFQSVMRRFKRAVTTAGVLQECRQRRYFETTQERKKRKTQNARRAIRQQSRDASAANRYQNNNNNQQSNS